MVSKERILNIFLAIFKRWGHRVVRPGPGHVAAKGPVSGKDFSFFHGWLKRIIWQDVEYYSGGKKSNVLMTSDVNPDSGKVYPDYIERRRKAKEKPKESYAETLPYDPFPHG